MRPTTAKSRLSKGSTAGNTKPTTEKAGKDSHASSTDLDMKISGKEMTTNTNALPRYRGIRMNIEDEPDSAGL